jgi:hypothetical protein
MVTYTRRTVLDAVCDERVAMSKLMRAAGAVVVALLAVFAFAGPASAQAVAEDEYPDAVCTIEITITPDGIRIVIECVGFPPGVTVTITIDGEVLGEFVVAPDGTVSAEGLIPNDCEEHTVTVSGGGVTRTSTFQGTNCPAAPVQAGTLPFTGSDSSLPMAQIGVALLAAGALVTFGVRRARAAKA